MDKKQVLNVVFGVAFALSIVAIFGLFMECVNYITLSGTYISGYANFQSLWLKFALCNGVPMLVGILAIIFLIIGHFKQKKGLKKAGTILTLVTAILLLVVSVIASLLFTNISATEYTLIYALKAQTASAAACFAVLFGCLIIHAKTKNQE